METKRLAGIIAATAVAAFVSGVSAAAPAAASGDNEVVGIEQTVGGPGGSQIAYTVTKILPSVDPVAYPVAGQLYEATVMAKAVNGTAVPLVSFFTARAGSGANYPALVDVSSLSGAPLQDGATTDGKVYFDVVGPVPTSVVYNDPPDGMLSWQEPTSGEPTSGESSSGSSSGSATSGGGGSEGGVTGSTGPNQVGPSTSGGDIGGGEGGTEGGGGNLSSGGGSGAPNGDTGGSSGRG